MTVQLAPLVTLSSCQRSVGFLDENTLNRANLRNLFRDAFNDEGRVDKDLKPEAVGTRTLTPCWVLQALVCWI